MTLNAVGLVLPGSEVGGQLVPGGHAVAFHSELFLVADAKAKGAEDRGLVFVAT